MKSSIVLRRALATGTIISLGFGVACAQDPTAPAVEAPGVAETTPAPATQSGENGVTSSAPVTLPPAVEDVLKLTKAQLSENLVLNFIHNSGTTYHLTPQDIAYLRSQGVSDRVINAILDQNKGIIELSPPAPASAPPANQAPADMNGAPAYSQESAADTQPAASTVYVSPYSSGYYPYYGYGGYPYYYGYPYYAYYPYYCWPPAVSFGFAFGGHGHVHNGHFHGYYGHYHGGSVYHGVPGGGVHGGGVHGAMGSHGGGGFHGGHGH